MHLRVAADTIRVRQSSQSNERICRAGARPYKIVCAGPARIAKNLDMAFLLQQLSRRWATPALICLAAFVILFALAGQTFNAPFVYYSPR